MYAVIKTGGKQYRVGLGDVLKIEKLPGDVGSTLEFADVIMVGEGAEITTGSPVAGAKVVAEVLSQRKDEKVLIFKKQRRKTYRRLNGHRQPITVVRISDILASGKSAKATAGDVVKAPRKVRKSKKTEAAAAEAAASE